MKTQKETVRLLCKSIITRLENSKAVSFPPRLRMVIQDEIYGLIGLYIWTDEDLRDKTLSKVGARAEMLENSQFTESDQYKAAKAVVRNTFGDDELNGFYFQKPIKVIAEIITGYLMRSSHIEDVYESDEDLVHQIVDITKNFDAKKLH